MAALLAGGVMGGLEPFAVLLVSLLASRVLCFKMFSARADDVQVSERCERRKRCQVPAVVPPIKCCAADF